MQPLPTQAPVPNECFLAMEPLDSSARSEESASSWEDEVELIHDFVENEIRQHLNLPPESDVAHLAQLIAIVQPIERVFTPQNHLNFLGWTRHAPRDELRLVLDIVYTVEHKSNIGPVLPTVIDRPDIDLNRIVRAEECTEPGCLRCRNRRGGWQFKWSGPWLCPATIPPHESQTWAELCTAIRECRCAVCMRNGL